MVPEVMTLHLLKGVFRTINSRFTWVFALEVLLLQYFPLMMSDDVHMYIRIACVCTVHVWKITWSIAHGIVL